MIKHRDKPRYKDLICEACGCLFDSKIRSAKQRFCSKKCSNSRANSSHFVPGCDSWNNGKSVSGMSEKKHSEETKKKIGTANKKENPITSANKLARRSPEYKEWRSLVFARDNYKCTECGSKDRLHPHHIKSFAKYEDLRYVVSNGLTLCEICHGKVHGMDFSVCRKKIKCQYCGDMFVPKNGHYKTKTCSKECRYKRQSEMPSKTKGVKRPHMQRARVAGCVECGEEFRAVKDTKTRKQKYCSRACYLKNRWNFTGKQAALESTGKTFDEMKADRV